MCRTPLTAHRSEAFTIKKGGHGRRRRECLVEEAGLLVAKRSWGSHRALRIAQNFLEHPTLMLRGQEEELRLTENTTSLLLFSTHKEVGDQSLASSICFVTILCKNKR